MITARPYQTALVFEIVKLFAKGHRRLIVQLPTGAGKTAIASMLAVRAGALRILYIVPSDEILTQTSKSFDRVKVKHAILSAGKTFGLQKVSCLLAMSQTLSRRFGSSMFDDWTPDLIFVDEIHKLIKQHRRILNFWPACPVIGLTATPVRLDGEPLSELCPVLVCGPSIKSLQKQGFLVQCRTINAYMPDLSGIKKSKGDFDVGQLDAAYCDEKVVLSAPDWWLRFAKGRRTIAFTPGISSSKKLVKAYQARGIRCEHVDGTTPKAVRIAALERLRKHEIDVLFNCALFIEGLDCIEVSCIQILTSTHSLNRFLQQCGRGLRPAPSKDGLVIIDHGGNSYRHDKVDADRDWYNNGASIEGLKKTCLCCQTIIEVHRNLCPACFKVPMPVPKHSPMAAQRAQRAVSKATPIRPCPQWAAGVSEAWARAEALRFAAGEALETPERLCRRLLRQAAA